MSQTTSVETTDIAPRSLYRASGLAALTAGALFRRNIAAEIALFSGQPSPEGVSDWFALLQRNRLLGLASLNVFDIVNYILVGLMYLGLYAALMRAGKGRMTIATALGFMGIAVYLATNTAFSMLSLSEQYASAAPGAARSTLLAAGQAMLALNRFSAPGAHPGSGGLASLFLIAVAGLLTSMVMLRGGVFSRAAAWVGLLASGLDLAYCLAYLFLPAVDRQLLAVSFIPAAGLLLMIWHLLVGWRLYRLGSGKPAPTTPAG